jgi:hypothetical protein
LILAIPLFLALAAVIIPVTIMLVTEEMPAVQRLGYACLLAFFYFCALVSGRILLLRPERHQEVLATAPVDSRAFMEAALSYFQSRGTTFRWVALFWIVMATMMVIISSAPKVPLRTSLIAIFFSIVLPASVSWRWFWREHTTRKVLNQLREAPIEKQLEGLRILLEMRVGDPVVKLIRDRLGGIMPGWRK